jgi:hypothetical protein
MNEFETLGAAETLVARQTRDAIEMCLKHCGTITERLGKIDLDGIEDLMLDSDARKNVIMLCEHVQRLSKNLNDSTLLVSLAAILLTKSE